MPERYADKVRIAGGRFSTIYRARDLISDKLVALKVIDIDDGEQAPHSLATEVAVLRQLTAQGNSASNSTSVSSHHVIEFYGEFQAHEDLYLVFPYYAYTLTDYIKANSRIRTNFAQLSSVSTSANSGDSASQFAEPLDDYFENDDSFAGAEQDAPTVYSRVSKIAPAEALEIVHDILQALSFVHANGVVHRDVKPENIMLERVSGAGGARLNAVLIDFGICYPENVAGVKKQNEPLASEKFTQISTGVYKPPEVLLGITDYAYEVDVWSLGIIMTQLFSKNCLPVLHKSGNFSDLALLTTIFQTFGTPTVAEWPRVAEIKYFETFNFTIWPRIETARMVPRLDEPKFVRMFEQMMVYDTRKRLTAQEALANF